MKGVLLLSAVGLGMVMVFSCAVAPAPEPAPAPPPPMKIEPRPKPAEIVSPAPTVWEEVVSWGGSRETGRRVLSPQEVDAYVRQGRLKLDGPSTQVFEVGQMTRVGPRRITLVRKPAPLANGLQ